MDKLAKTISKTNLKEYENYGFTFEGKQASVIEAHRPSHSTIRPCPEESVDWDTTENLYIEGDNLEVLKLLQDSYKGKVGMIYIDPPYNTGKDNKGYKDNFHISKKELTQKKYDPHHVARNQDKLKTDISEGMALAKKYYIEGHVFQTYLAIMDIEPGKSHIIENLDGYEVYNYNNNQAIGCFTKKKIPEETLKKIALRHPQYVFLRKSIFKKKDEIIKMRDEIFMPISPETQFGLWNGSATEQLKKEKEKEEKKKEKEKRKEERKK